MLELTASLPHYNDMEGGYTAAKEKAGLILLKDTPARRIVWYDMIPVHIMKSSQDLRSKKG